MGLRILKRKQAKFEIKTKEKSAGSGMLVLPSPPQRGEGNISNPRVLSDMGLAIPRPTRLGDPRSSSLLLRTSRISVALGVGEENCRSRDRSSAGPLSFLSF